MAALKKHLINDPSTVVVDGLKGLAYLNPAVELDEESRVVSLRNVSSDQVHLICGGGAGHEPAHAAFVGDGMLSAAVSGNVFASPNSGQVTSGLQKLADGKGTLIVVKNYTGDVLHFGIAKEQWVAHHPGQEDKVRMVIVGDDVAVGKSQGGIVGRRGLAGTVLVYKLAGALAAKGESLDRVHAVAEYVASRSATIAVGLEHCNVPGSEGEGSGLKNDEMEVGMGIHNEPGFQRKSIGSASSVVGDLLTTLTSTKDEDRSFLPFSERGGDSVVLLVNNLGGLSELELPGVVKEAGAWLQQRKISVKRVLSGTYMTSLNMPGVSLSVVLLPRPDDAVTKAGLKITEELLLELLDAPTSAPGWKPASKAEPAVEVFEAKKDTKERPAPSASAEPGPKWEKPDAFLRAVESACKALAKAEPEITRYDTVAGDGDCGTTLKAGADGVLGQVQEGGIKGEDAVADLLAISDVVDHAMGGTSGGLYSIFFNSLAVGVREFADDKHGVTAQVWAKSLERALNTLFRYTRARPPSRTLVDPLSSFVTTFATEPEFEKALEAAKEAAEATAYLDAKAGRAAYVDQKALKGEQVPDAGAWGVWIILDAIRASLVAPSD